MKRAARRLGIHAFESASVLRPSARGRMRRPAVPFPCSRSRATRAPERNAASFSEAALESYAHADSSDVSLRPLLSGWGLLPACARRRGHSDLAQDHRSTAVSGRSTFYAGLEGRTVQGPLA